MFEKLLNRGRVPSRYGLRLGAAKGIRRPVTSNRLLTLQLANGRDGRRPGLDRRCDHITDTFRMPSQTTHTLEPESVFRSERASRSKHCCHLFGTLERLVRQSSICAVLLWNDSQNTAGG